MDNSSLTTKDMTPEEIIKKHIPSGCINIKGGYEAEIKTIVSAVQEYAEQYATQREAGEANKTIVIKWMEVKNDSLYEKEMRVMESYHENYPVGSRFDYGFMDIVSSKGYIVKLIPLLSDRFKDLKLTKNPSPPKSNP